MARRTRKPATKKSAAKTTKASEPKPEPKVKAKPETTPKAEPKVEAKPEPKPEPKAEAKSEPKPVKKLPAPRVSGTYSSPGSSVKLAYREDRFDREIIDEVFKTDIYRMWAWKLPAGSVVVDIGAHIGAFTAFVHSLVPDAKLIAVEIDEDNCAVCEANVGPYATVIHAACVGDVLPLGYYQGGSNSGGSRMTFEKMSIMRPLPDALTLSQIIEQQGLDRIDMLKLDCEGCEHSVLRKAAADGSLKLVQRIAAEYHEFFGEKLDALKALLTSEGFAIELAPICPISGHIFAVRTR